MAYDRWKETRHRELDKLRPGDEVVVYVGNSIKKCKVERVTATQIIVNGNRYSKSRGRKIGHDSSWCVDQIEVYVPEKHDSELQEIADHTERYQLRRSLEEHIKTGSLELLRKMKEAVS